MAVMNDDHDPALAPYCQPSPNERRTSAEPMPDVTDRLARVLHTGPTRR